MPAFHSSEAEAARYALLRRLGPSFRHHLVVHLQPIGMICEVMDRRLRSTTPDLAQVRDNTQKISAFAKGALNSCVEVVGWLAPDDNATSTVHAGARECAALLATSLSFRGYALRNEVPELPGTVRRASIRNLLTATLMYCTDHHAAPADLLLSASGDAEAARIAVQMRPTPGESAVATEAAYRKLEWSDLQALAAAEGVGLERAGERVELILPWQAAG